MPPEVVSTVPATSSTNVPVSLAVQLTFSEPMNPTAVAVSSNPVVSFGTPSWNPNNTVVTLPHATAFSFNTSYTMTVNGSDVAGNAMSPAYSLTFTTEMAADTTPPSVSATIPANLATMVVTSSPLTITFNEPMSTSSVTVTPTPAVTFGTPSWANNNTELTLTPTTAMATNQMYTVSVTGRDVAGNMMTAAYVFSFTTAPPPDTTPPTLSSSVPANNAMNVTVGTKLALTFSEAMNTTSVSATTTPVVALGTGTWSNGDKTITFSAAPDWASSTSYSVDIQGADVAGNMLATTSISFTTAAPPDTTPPTVQSTSPSGMATGVPINTNIEFNFSEAMAQAVTEMAFSATPAITNCVFTWNGARTLMVCNPASDLAYSTTYTIRLGVGATDDAGNHLAAEYSFSFTTASAPDTTRPTIVSTAPANNAVGVARTTTLAVTFSEAMNRAATQAALQILSPTGLNGGTFAWDRLGRTVTYTLPSTLPYGTVVTWQVTNVATDLAGNALAATANFTFRVKRYTSQAFYATGTTDTAFSDARAGYIQSNTTCSQASIFTYSQAAVGDRYNTSNPGQNTYRGFMTFDISALASLANVNISTAYLYAYQYYCNGAPYSATFGSSINVYHVDYGTTIDLADCSITVLGGLNYPLSNNTTLAWKAATVTPAVVDDFNNRSTRGNRSQFMFRTATWASNGDAVSDYCVFGSHNYTAGYHPYLRIYYEYD